MKKNVTARFGLLIAIMLALTVVLAACGGSNSSNAPANNGKNTEKPADKVKLKVATWAGAEELREFEELVAKVNTTATDYVIEVQSIPADYYQKLQTMIAGKQSPDFMWLSQEYIAQYASLGAIAPLDEHLNGLASYKADDYFQGTIDVGQYKDKLYALPWISQPYMLYYNQDMFEKAGVELPTNDWTWEDFIAAGKQLTKDGEWGALLNNIPTAMYTWSYGGDVFDKDGNIKLDSPESIKGLEMYQSVVKSGIAPARAQADSMGNGDMFKTGKVAMFVGGAGDDFEKSSSFKVGMVLPPHGTEKVTFSWIGVTAMASSTKNPEIATKALVDMTNAIHQWKVVAPTKSGFDLIKTSRPEKEYAVETIRQASEVARGFNNQPKQGEIDGAIWEKLTQAIEKGDDVNAAVKSTIDKINTITK
ncbi:multiple sugar transport system substrate-binding protein [Paenibacillus castaneae]|uniref:sugar ABC transporter substrate-binding protein n=1 Tax=Paenibacillus castaneae TaxID=474957 RepID=UPI000C9B6E28|nr:sugar ABC transporter substrate-binding protein [Paenibacillus castaneae]NIK78097.1 multiple sugar transport system substrate-binding protein [Paenibacillus castaneae]